jgi:hypothetical protein
LNCTTGTPLKRKLQEVSSEKAAFRLKSERRVEALNTTTGADCVGGGAFSATWRASWAMRACCGEAQPIRNHGLFSKAEKALTIAGWSERARRDIEIFPLEDVEGLTPILMVLADDGSIERAEEEEAQRAAAKRSWFSFGRGEPNSA